MRDPQGGLTFAGEQVIRRLVAPLPPDHFLYSRLAAEWVASGLLIPFRFTDDTTVVSPRLPFVSQPPEWCDSQLFDAAKLTLDLAERGIAGGFELKDGSAWNIIFDGAAPVFCDHLSFAPLEGKLWWAGGQFARHFVVPLLISRQRKLPAHMTFRAWRDGMPPEAARGLLGLSRFLTRSWPLMAAGDAAKAKDSKSNNRDAGDANESRKFRQRLHASLAWMLDGAAPRESKAARGVWRGYVGGRPQYPGASLDDKMKRVSQWLTVTMPSWVGDLGCNTGEFTRMALAAGAKVVALDGDHDSVDRLYRTHRGDRRVHPVLMPLDDLQGGRGWLGTEHAGLAQRAEQAFDMLMMLALVHHLAIAAAIPMAQVAVLAAKWTSRWLIVELIHPEDPQVELLCSQRRREPNEFSLQQQFDAFAAAGFVLVEQFPLKPAARTLCLMRKLA